MSWPRRLRGCRTPPGEALPASYSVKQAHNLADAKRFFAEEDFDLVVTDLRMDTPSDGFDLLEFVKKSRPATEVIVVTAHGDVTTAVEAMRRGAYDFIQKPLDLEVIRRRCGVRGKRFCWAANQELAAALDVRYGLQGEGGIIGQSQSQCGGSCS